jgi:hypothetical protein
MAGAEPIDVYSDQFGLNVGAYGTSLNFSVSGATPPAPGTAPQVERLATIRMSLEHLKVMAFVIRRQILQYEQQTGVNIQVPVEVLNSLRISREDWEAVWR